MSDGKIYPDKATFEADLDRLTGVFLELKVAAQGQGIEIETTALRALSASWSLAGTKRQGQNG